MKWIKYKIVVNIINTGTSSEPVYEHILADKKVGYSEANLAIAQNEAYNGEYSVEEDSSSYENKPLDIEFGGTGAKTPEAAREKLEITPENIGAIPIIEAYCVENTETVRNAKLAEIYNSMASNTRLFVKLMASGAMHDVFISKTNANYGFMYIDQYGNSAQKKRTLSGGVWGAWYTVINTSNLLDNYPQILTTARKFVVSSENYGSTLPAAGTKGRIFFKVVG